MANAEDPQQGGPAAGFTVVRHGYDRTEVNRYIQQLEANVRHANAERDFFHQQVAELATNLESARREIASLNERLDALGKESGSQSREERTARALAVAKSQANEITTRAQAAADHTWAAAEQASAALRDRYQSLLAELDRQHQEIHAAHETIMASAREKVEEMTTAAERRRREIDAEAERDRIRIDREFSESMSVRRKALTKELEAQRKATTEESARIIREAQEEADRRLAAATAEVDRLSALRVQLAGQLRDTQQFLDRASATVRPVEQEREMTFEDTLLLPPPLPYDEPGTKPGKKPGPPTTPAERETSNPSGSPAQETNTPTPDANTPTPDANTRT
jgi:colicin import membrane protein